MERANPVTGGQTESETEQFEVVRPRPRGDAPKERPCMSCGKTFQSEGWHNRLCNTCQRRSTGAF